MLQPRESSSRSPAFPAREARGPHTGGRSIAWRLGVSRASPAKARVSQVAIEFTIGAEESHKIGEVGAHRIRRWLDSTFRFRIDRSIYDLDADGNPYPMMRLAQLTKVDPETGDALGPRFERFDLRGMLLDEDGIPGRILFVECKDYSEARQQGTLYDEYLAVCYSGFVKAGRDVEGPPDMEFMWATTHPLPRPDTRRLRQLNRSRRRASSILTASATNPSRCRSPSN